MPTIAEAIAAQEQRARKALGIPTELEALMESQARDMRQGQRAARQWFGKHKALAMGLSREEFWGGQLMGFDAWSDPTADSAITP
jgi:hypothetical protein